jgi:hypothetical protein
MVLLQLWSLLYLSYDRRVSKGAGSEARQQEPVQGSAFHGGDHPVGSPLVPAVPDQLS